MLLSNYLLKRECQVPRKELFRSWTFRPWRSKNRLSSTLRTWLEIKSHAAVPKNRQCSRNLRHLGHSTGTTFSFIFSFVSFAPKVSRRARKTCQSLDPCTAASRALSQWYPQEGRNRDGTGAIQEFLTGCCWLFYCFYWFRADFFQSLSTLRVFPLKDIHYLFGKTWDQKRQSVSGILDFSLL